MYAYNAIELTAKLRNAVGMVVYLKCQWKPQQLLFSDLFHIEIHCRITRDNSGKCGLRRSSAAAIRVVE